MATSLTERTRGNFLTVLQFLNPEGRGKKITLAIGIPVVAGMIAVGCDADIKRPIALLCTGACLFVGVAVGFLFGIPRTRQRDGPINSTHSKKREAEAADSDLEKQTDYVANTNLEEISDWLTKILVGIGLTQIGQIPSGLRRIAHYMGSGIGTGDEHEVFASAIIVYFAVIGFIGGYLLTRLFLAPALRLADLDARITALKNSSDEKFSALKKREDTLEEVLGHMQREGLRRINDENYHLSPGIVNADVALVEKLRGDWPSDRRVNIVLARLYRRQGRLDDAIKLLSSFIADWQGRPMTDEVKDGLAAALFNRACYHCLLWTQSKEEEDKQQSLEDLRDSIKLTPARSRTASEDHDLRPLYPLPEFKELTEAR